MEHEEETRATTTRLSRCRSREVPTSNTDRKSTTLIEIFMTFASVSRQTSRIKSKEVKAFTPHPSESIITNKAAVGSP